MSQARNRYTNNTVIGAGECFIDVLDTDESTNGERYLGDTTSGVLRIETEETTVVAGDGASPRILARAISNITRSFEVNLQDLSPENLALFILGDEGSQSDVAGDAVARADGVMSVKQGHWYQLGVSASKPAGVGAVKKAPAFNVYSTAGPGGGTTYTGTTFHSDGRVKAVGDYTLDDKAGRFYIEPGKRIADGDVYVAYSPVVQEFKTIAASARKQVKGAFRYIEDAAQGRGNNYYAPVAIIRPGGDMALKDRTAAQAVTLNVEILQPADGALSPLYINQQPLD